MWQLVQGKKASPTKDANAVDSVTSSPSQFLILAHITDVDEQGEGEIQQEEADFVYDLSLGPVINGAIGDEFNQRNLRTRSTTKTAAILGKIKKGNYKKVNGNRKNSKASGRKH